MKKYVMRVVGAANGQRLSIEGQFLKTFDFDWGKGLGFGVFTTEASQAMKFNSPSAVLSYWQTRSISYPDRADGKPNRPLTATTIAVEAIEETEHA